MLKTITWSIVLLLLSSSLLAQESPIQGTVIQENGEVLAHVHIALSGTSLGTVTNVDGRFTLRSKPTSTDSLIFTHMGFKTLILPCNYFRNSSSVVMQTQALQLDELTITNESPKEIVEKAFALVKQNYATTDNYLTGFFRETIQQDSTYLAFTEAVISIKKRGYTNYKADDLVKIEKARSKTDISKSEFLDHVNFRGSLVNSTRMDIISRKNFFSKKSFGYFDFELDDITQIQGRWVYVITFDKKANSKKGGLCGRFFIDSKSYAFARIELERNKTGLKADNKFGLKNELAMKALQLKLEKTKRKFILEYRLIGTQWFLFTTHYHLQMKAIEKGIPSLINLKTNLLVYDIAQKMSFDKSDAISDRKMTYRESAKYLDESFWEGYQFVPPSAAEQQLINKLIKK